MIFLSFCGATTVGSTLLDFRFFHFITVPWLFIRVSLKEQCLVLIARFRYEKLPFQSLKMLLRLNFVICLYIDIRHISKSQNSNGETSWGESYQYSFSFHENNLFVWLFNNSFFIILIIAQNVLLSSDVSIHITFLSFFHVRSRSIHFW